MIPQDELRGTRGIPPPRPRRRWDLVAFCAVLAGPVLGVALWLADRQRVGDLEERLTRDANATFSARHGRPVHVEVPVPGAFGDAAARHLPAIQAESRAMQETEAARARAVVAGERPISDLPEPYSRALARLDQDLDGLLRGTRAERADLPLARRSFMPCDGADWVGYQFAALLAGVRIRRALAAGEAGRAASGCLDGLALGRDAAISAGLLGHMTAAGIAARLVPPCAAAVTALRPADRADAVRRVRSIRDAFPSVEETFRVELLSIELARFGPLMDRPARARLVLEALPHLRDGEREIGFRERLALRDSWRATRAAWDALLGAARLDRGGARDAGILAVKDGTLRRANPLVSVLRDVDYARYARRADAAILRLDAVAILAAATMHRDRTGEWPASTRTLLREGLVSPAEAERCAGATLAVHDAGRVLELKLGVPTGDDKAPRSDLVLRVNSRAAPRGGRAR